MASKTISTKNCAVEKDSYLKFALYVSEFT